VNLIFGAVILTYTEVAKAHVRRSPDSWFSRNLAW
jgi:hypothetical protein